MALSPRGRGRGGRRGRDRGGGLGSAGIGEKATVGEEEEGD